jgi:RimJ/RimL family protein N-acetyltransferase
MPAARVVRGERCGHNDRSNAAAGIRRIYGDVLATNARMLRFVTRLGFTVKPDAADPRVMRAELPLQS